MAERYKKDSKNDSNDRLREYENNLRIDEHRLEEEARDNAERFYDVAKDHAFAVSRRDQAKSILAETEARADLAIRKAAAVADEKVTVQEVEARRKTDPEYLEAVGQYSIMSERAATWSALKEAYQQRSYALNHLVDLYIARYYGNIERKGSGDMRTVKADDNRRKMSDARRSRDDD